MKVASFNRWRLPRLADCGEFGNPGKCLDRVMKKASSSKEITKAMNFDRKRSSDGIA